MRGEHNFVEDSKETYHRTVFCRKCGAVAWFYNGDKEWNVKNLQGNIPQCLSTNKESK